MDVRQRTGGSGGESGGRRRAPLKTPAVAGLVGLLHSARAEPPPPVKRTGGAWLGLLPPKCTGTPRLSQCVGWVLMSGTIVSTRCCTSSGPTTGAPGRVSSTLEDTTMTRCSDGTTSISCPANPNA